MILHNTFRSLSCIALALAAVGSAPAQSLDDLLDQAIQDRIESELESTLSDALQQALEAKIAEGIEADLADGVARAGALAGEALRRVEELAPAASEAFYPSIDGDGWTIERDVWIVLVTPRQLARVEREGLVVRERRRLESVGLVLLRVESPQDPTRAEAVLQRILETPGAQIDRNHIYRPGRGKQERGTADAPAPDPVKGVVVGMIDSALDDRHEALRRADIVQEDFVSFARPRPRDHGTAVASILVGASNEVQGRIRGARLLAASVFFQDEGGASAATTSSLVRALDWAAVSGARVVNMSLSGPPNRVLEAAVDRVTTRGTLIVAAVGNEGPTVRPLYPAAYPAVVGVTAIDANERAYRYANRGSEVTFAAPGVNVRVAAADGGYTRESGTSMAAPHVTASIARRLASRSASPQRTLSKLVADAVDLGEPGFDETFGFGRIASAE